MIRCMNYELSLKSEEMETIDLEQAKEYALSMENSFRHSLWKKKCKLFVWMNEERVKFF